MKDTFVRYIKSDEITFKHAKGMIDVVGREIHLYNEIFLFLGGDAEFISESMKIKLKPNTIVLIPKERFHQFNRLSKPDSYQRYVLQFCDISDFSGLVSEVLSEIKVIQEPGGLLSYFERLADDRKNIFSESEKAILLKSALAEILLDLKYLSYDISEEESINSVVKSAVEYINEHITENIKIKAVADEIHFSKTYLSHVFKETMHISIYQYILKKKLILAYDKISNSVPAVKAAEQCGFRDYSGFYRDFRKYFGISPAQAEKNGLRLD